MRSPLRKRDHRDEDTATRRSPSTWVFGQWTVGGETFDICVRTEDRARLAAAFDREAAPPTGGQAHLYDPPHPGKRGV